jgi:hypothetical protein
MTTADAKKRLLQEMRSKIADVYLSDDQLGEPPSVCLMALDFEPHSN